MPIIPGQIPPDAARAFMATHRADEFTLLDVRQGWEYEEFHLPGATLVPLAELADRARELDPKKPAIVYCLAGVRSASAAKLLAGLGFADVSSLTGGVKAWRGETAFGPVDLGLEWLAPSASAEQTLLVAYALEQHLRELYERLAREAKTSEAAEIFGRLAGFEERHAQILHARSALILGQSLPREEFAAKALRAVAPGIVEGGAPAEAFLRDRRGLGEDPRQALDLAMGVEAQALDYYLRCLARTQEPEARNLLVTLAGEEKSHLKVLAGFLDTRPGGAQGTSAG